MSSRITACPAEESLYMLADGALDERESQRVREHVTKCSNCRRVFCEAESLQGISRTLGAAKLVDRDHERIKRCEERTLPKLRASLSDFGDESDAAI